MNIRRYSSEWSWSTSRRLSYGTDHKPEILLAKKRCTFSILLMLIFVWFTSVQDYHEQGQKLNIVLISYFYSWVTGDPIVHSSTVTCMDSSWIHQWIHLTFHQWIHGGIPCTHSLIDPRWFHAWYRLWFTEQSTMDPCMVLHESNNESTSHAWYGATNGSKHDTMSYCIVRRGMQSVPIISPTQACLTYSAMSPHVASLILLKKLVFIAKYDHHIVFIFYKRICILSPHMINKFFLLLSFLSFI